MFNWIFSCLLIVLSGLSATAHANSHSHSTNLIFESLPKPNLTTISTVTAIAQDHQGFIWLGTINGLIRFDGLSFKTFRSTDTKPTRLTNDWINSIFIDKNRQIWIGSKTGIQRFDPDSEVFSSYQLPEKNGQIVSTVSIGQIISDRSGNLWIASHQGILFFDINAQKFSWIHHRTNDPTSIRSDNIYAIFNDSEDRIWVSTEDGVDLLASNTRRVQHIKFNTNEQRAVRVWSFGLDAEHRLWLGLTDGLAYIDLKERSQFPTLARVDQSNIALGADPVMKILLSSNGDLWVASRNKGLFRKPNATDRFEHFRHSDDDSYSLCDNEVFSLYEDRAAVLWVGTWNGGACHVDLLSAGFSRIAVNHKSGGTEENRGTRSVLRDQDGDVIWSSNDGFLNILSRSNRELNSWPIRLDSGDIVQIHALVEGREGRVWGITYDGIRAIEKNRQTKLGDYIAKFPHGLVPQIFCAIVDRDGDFWMTTSKGVFIYRTAQRQLQRMLHRPGNANSLANDYVYPIVQDLNGMIWMGTPTGLQAYDKATDKFSFYRHDPTNPDSLVSGNVTALEVDSNGNLWIGTNYNLSRMHTSKDGRVRFHSYQTLSLVNAIKQDHFQHIWISTDAGISKFDPKTEKFAHFFEYDGITKGVFRSGVSYIDQQGIIYFGGPHGITEVRPNQLKQNLIPPMTAITALRFLNQNGAQSASRWGLSTPSELNAARELKLEYEQASFEIELAALHFSRASSNEFAYKLIGFDQQWRMSDSSNRTATYTNLKPGVYAFYLKAANKAQVWSREELKLRIVVLPPWWEQWWVQFFGIFFVLCVIWWLHSTRINQLLRKKKVLEAEVALRTQMISQQNKDKSKFIADAAHDLRQPMQAIGNLLEAAHIALKKEESIKATQLVRLAMKATGIMRSSFNAILELSRIETGLVSPVIETINLNSLIDELIETLQPQTINQTIFIRFVPSKSSPLFVRSDKNMLFRVLSNLVTNAIKYRDDKKSYSEVVIRCVSLKEQVVINVIDNGIGIDPLLHDKIFQAFFQVNNESKDRDRGLGLGLSIVAAMLRILPEHTLKMYSTPSRGSRFRLALSRAEISDEVKLANVESRPCQYAKMEGVFLIYVENDELVRMSTLSLFKSQGILYEVFVSYDDMQAKLPQIERIPDLILTDHHLPGQKFSIDVITSIREFFGIMIPAIVLTGETMELPPQVQHNANGVLHKPISPDELFSAIADLMPEMISDRIID